jgi:hypothetical protein
MMFTMSGVSRFASAAQHKERGEIRGSEEEEEDGAIRGS